MIEVIIGAESSINGDVASKGVVRTDGAITGNIEADWLIVGGTGMVKGDVATRGIVIAGTVEGNIRSSEMVEIKSETDGIIQEIRYEAGQKVDKGQPLVLLDDSKLAASLAEGGRAGAAVPAVGGGCRWARWPRDLFEYQP